ncbi:hypothetical protein [Streptomyces sp. NBC_01294]|uniref:hypothetical protein n=1 Tax=Streptomyces sp. NBC_01294 TaxID=2903815 RepID=UPI002DDBC360|nr:hypothetical protein [Streptomyces sp. NBC_01294]WRZ60798.1 hypothetical protein OG534_32485 [Streptomyces sp. NBC_01294]
MALTTDRPLVTAPAPLPAGCGPERPTPLWVLVSLGILSSAVIAGACWMSGHVHADTTLRTAARFFHVAALIVGLGAVLAVDWFGILWLLGKRRLSDITGTACALQIPIWLGMAGLVVTGLFLRPNLDSPLTLVKVGLVLAVTVNGLYAHRIGQRLERYGDDVPMPRHLMVQSGLAAAVSQTGWWGATLIGFLNSQS